MVEKTIMKSAQVYANEVKKIINPQAIILYGSHVKGTAAADSDIDIAVICNGIDGDFLETSAILWKLTANTDYRIEPLLLDSTKEDYSGFMQEVINTGVVVG